jgi:hypothetical protein
LCSRGAPRPRHRRPSLSLAEVAEVAVGLGEAELATEPGVALPWRARRVTRMGRT